MGGRCPDTLSDEETAWIEAAKTVHTHVHLAIDLIQAFARLVRRQPSSHTFDSWPAEVEASPLTALQTFAKGLREDCAAVRAALQTNWSNGPTEGHVNRLKCVKRSMYGRGNFDLLRQRLLAA